MVVNETGCGHGCAAYFVVGLLGTAIVVASGGGDSALEGVAFFAFAAGILAFINGAMLAEDREKAEQKKLVAELDAELDAALSLIREHQAVLSRKRALSMREDDYGNVIDQEWQKEIDYFLNNVLSGIEVPERWARQQIEIFAAGSDGTDSGIMPQSVSEFSGAEYEFLCAKLLREAGWDASLTQASNDQGADIIAQRDGLRVVVQCKRYAKPVGNKAVQEVVAAKAITGAHKAVVITNAGYTNACKELAAANQVLLLHHDDLSALEAKLWT